MIDTGVIVSAAIKKDGTSRKAFIKAVSEWTPLLSLDTLVEIIEVLRRPKFKLLVTEDNLISICELLTHKGELVEVTSNVQVCRDSTDDKFLNLAKDGKADLILTRDPDLLIIQKFENIPVINPSAFLKLEI